MRSPQKVREQEKLVEEKGEKSEGIWDLDPGVTEKAEHAFSGHPCTTSSNWLLLAAVPPLEWRRTGRPPVKIPTRLSVLSFFLRLTTAGGPQKQKDAGDLLAFFLRCLTRKAQVPA